MAKKDTRNKLKSGLTASVIATHFFAFLALDILLLILVAIGGVVFAERIACDVMHQLEDAPKGSAIAENDEDRRAFSLGNVSVSYSDTVSADTFSIEGINGIFPENTRKGLRGLRYDRNYDKPAHSLSYVVVIQRERVRAESEPARRATNAGRVEDATGSEGTASDYTTIEIHLGNSLAIVEVVFYIILIFELLSLIRTGIKSNKAVRKALRPLRELSAATQALADSSGSRAKRYSPEALNHLANALDAVGAGRLDQRIPSEVMSDELKPLAVAINDMLARLDDAYSAQAQFVSDASHELRTPIAVIQGYASILSRWGSEDPETLQESIEAIQSEAAAMKQMVNQLLFLAGSDNAFLKPDWHKLNLSDIASEVIKEEILIDETHVFESFIEEDVFVDGDAGLLKQLFRILSDNSVKYTEAGGTITVKLTRMPAETNAGGAFAAGAYAGGASSKSASAHGGFAHGTSAYGGSAHGTSAHGRFADGGVADSAFANGRAMLSVQDEGVGIPAHILPHIFDRFVRADESRTRNTGGAGLGLSIAKRIAEQHGGYIEVVSSEGAGSRFTVILPLSAPESETGPAEQN